MIYEIPDIDHLREILDYDPETGRFIWRRMESPGYRGQRYAASWNKRYAGTPAGNYDPKRSYRQISVSGRLYHAPVLAFAHVHGRGPIPPLIHINWQWDDNRIHNLREATPKEHASYLASVQRHAAAERKSRAEHRKWMIERGHARPARRQGV